MPNVINYRPDSEELDKLTAGWVMANRISDVVAKPSSKRYRRYMGVVENQFVDKHFVDPDSAWRHKELLPRALDAYSLRHGVEPTRGKLFALPDFMIAAAPDAVEQDGIGYTVRCRQTSETYEEAVGIGITPEMIRIGQAMMWVTGCWFFWVFLDYFECPRERKRRLFEHVVTPDQRHQERMGDALINFCMKTRLRASR